MFPYPFSFLSTSETGETDFVIEVEIVDDGSAASRDFQFRSWGSAGSYTQDIDIDWGDGTSDTNHTTDTITHAYPATGGTATYDIKVTGQFGPRFGNSGDKEKIKEIKNWGESAVIYDAFEYAFTDCVGITTVSATDKPVFYDSAPTARPNPRLREAFDTLTALTSLNVNDWTIPSGYNNNCTRLFAAASNCTSLSANNWDLGSASNTSSMFNGVGNALTTDGCEITATGMNHGSSTTIANMFQNARVKSVDVSGWTLKTSGTVSCTSLFYQYRVLTAGAEINLSNWVNTNNISALNNAFRTTAATTAEHTINISGWAGTDSCTSMQYFCHSNYYLTLIKGLNSLTSNSLTTALVMFHNCYRLNFSDTDGATFSNDFATNLGSCTNMGSMFRGVGSQLGSGAEVPSELSNFVVTGATNMSSMFQGSKWTTNINSSVEGWNPSSVTNVISMFYNCTTVGDLDLSSWNTGAIADLVNFCRDSNCTSLIFGSNWDFSSVDKMNYTMYGTTSPVTNIVFPTNADFSSLEQASAFVGNGTMGTSNYDNFLDRMQVTWNTALTPATLGMASSQYTKSILTTGTATSTLANKLVDTSKDFSASGLNVQVNDIVFDDTGNDYARVTAVDNATTLSLNADIIISGDAYEIDQGAAAKDKEYLIDNGWTIADANGTS